jgi:arylsulfatase A-like enzyme
MKTKNILLIVMDQFRADLLHGDLAHCVDLPNIRALMRDATHFGAHYSVANPCGPSRASLLTGQYAMNHRSVRNGTPLDRSIPNIAGIMRTGGYDPMLLGYTDTPGDPRVCDPDDPALHSYESVMAGFDEVLEMRQGKSHPWRVHLAAKGYELPHYRDFYVPDGDDLDSPAFYAAEDSDTAFLTDQCLKTLARQRGKSWFTHLTYIRPHPPFVAPAPFSTRYRGAGLPQPVRLDPGLADHPFVRNSRAGNPLARFVDGFGDLQPTEENTRIIRQVYLGLASEVDHHIGRVMQLLKDSGQYDDTLIVLCSDHGEMLGDLDSWGKNTVFDAAYRVPLIIRVPESPMQGKTVSLVTESVDILPTILEYAGLEIPPSVDGRSLIPLMAGRRPADWRDYSYSELDFGHPLAEKRSPLAAAMPTGQCNVAMLRQANMTLVHFNGGLPAMLFDYADRGEAKNLADDPTHAGEMLRLTRKLLDHRMTFADTTLSNYAITADGPKLGA